MDSDKLAAVRQQAQTDLIALEKSGAILPLQLKPSEAFYLLSVLQLALRHPGIAGTHPGNFARSLAENIERRVAKTDALAFMARAGWNLDHGTAATAPAPESASTSDETRKPRRTARGRK